MTGRALLYHATRGDFLASIAGDGLRSGSYWAADEDLLDYYVETVEDEGRVRRAGNRPAGAAAGPRRG